MYSPKFAKKYILTLFMIFALVMMLVFPSSAWAQAPQTTAEGKGILQLFGEILVTIPTLYALSAILYAVFTLLSFIITLTASLFNQLLEAMVAFDPGNLEAIRLGWTISRDIANALLILILLWIAFTIIFNIEHLGGKKLAIRVIVVALLMNFSLLLVNTVFIFANTLANAFVKNYPTQSNDPTKPSNELTNPPRLAVIEHIINATKLMALTDQPTPADIELFKKTKGAAPATTGAQVPKIQGSQKPSELKLRPDVSSSLMASLGIKSAKAQKGVIAGCGIGAALGLVLPVVGTVAGCAIGGITGALTEIFSGGDPLQGAISLNIRLGVAILLLLATTLTILYGVFMFINRIIAMIILSVLAPIAFIAWLIPTDEAKKYWKLWVDNLIKRALFAPIFAFFLYISLLILERYNQFQNLAPYRPTPKIDTDTLLLLVFSLAFMILALRTAKEGGGVIADTAISWGKKLAGLGLAGAAGLGGLAVTRAGITSQMVQPAMEQLARIPVLGQITAPFARGVTRYLKRRESEVKERSKQLGDMTPEEAAAEYFRSTFTKNKVAAANYLAEKGRFTLLGANMEEAINLAGRFGTETRDALLKRRPDLVRQEHMEGAISADDARARFIAKMKAEEVGNIEFGGIAPAVRETILAEMFKKGSGALREVSGAMQRMPSEIRSGMADELNRVLQNEGNWDNLAVQDPVAHEGNLAYIVSNAGRQLITGGRMPPFLERKAGEKGYLRRRQ